MIAGPSDRLIPLEGTAMAPVLAAMHKECFDAPWDDAAMIGVLAGPGVFALIVESGPAKPRSVKPRSDQPPSDQPQTDRPIGFVLARAAGPELEILTLCVLPGGRRQGAGHRLITALISEGERRHLAEIFLEVAEDNGPARALYAAHGFKRTGVRPGYYKSQKPGDGVAGLTMSRALAQP